MQRSQNELADRIERASALGNPEGRYDLASKVEVKAYVAREVERINYDMARVSALEARIAELELSWWQKVKRWFSRGGSMGLRKVGKPPEFAAPYGIAESAESKTPYFIGR